MNSDVEKYRGRACLALISLALWITVFVAFAVIDAQTDLNGFTGMGLGVIFTVVNAVLFIWTRQRLRSAQRRELDQQN